MTRDELIEKMARAITLAEGIHPEWIDKRWREYEDAASAALAVITEWLEGEAAKPYVSRNILKKERIEYDAIRRLIAITKGDAP